MMKNFLEGLEENAGSIITEAKAGGSGTDKGKSIQDFEGCKWGYVPKPKDGKTGFGSSKSLLFIKENNPDSWDILVFRKNVASGKASSKEGKAAIDGVLGTIKSKSDVKESASKEIGNWMAMTESILKSKTLNESKLGNIKGSPELLDGYVVSNQISGLKFADLLEKCVNVVSPGKSGGSTSFLNK